MHVIGLGTFAMDVLMKVDTLPAEDAFCIIEETVYLPGGSGTNVIAQLARLGVDCGYVGKIADDTVGRAILKSLVDAGVDTSRMVVAPTGITLHTNIVVDHQGNKFIMLNMGDVAFTLSLEEIETAYLTSGKVFYTDLFPKLPAQSGLKAARAAGVVTVFNLQVGLDTMKSLGVSKEELLDSLAYVDFFAPCRDGLYALCGTKDLDACQAFLRPYCKGTLLFTLGKEGAVAYPLQGSPIWVSSIAVAAVDTTGAGDSFMGGFIYSHLLQGQPLKEAMRFATACAAYTCTGMGARHTPDLLEAQALMMGSGI